MKSSVRDVNRVLCFIRYNLERMRSINTSISLRLRKANQEDDKARVDSYLVGNIVSMTCLMMLEYTLPLIIA